MGLWDLLVTNSLLDFLHFWCAGWCGKSATHRDGLLVHATKKEEENPQVRADKEQPWRVVGYSLSSSTTSIKTLQHQLQILHHQTFMVSFYIPPHPSHLLPTAYQTQINAIPNMNALCVTQMPIPPFVAILAAALLLILPPLQHLL